MFHVKQNRLLCPVGHLLWKRRRFRKASSTEEVASRRLDGGVSGEHCSPLRFLFSKRVDNSSALPGISSMRGDNFAKPPLQRRWQAAGLTEESRANDVRPYRFLFLKRMDNSSALSGISSMRGDNFAKPPLQRRWQAAGLTVESRTNDVRPYGFSFRKG